MSKPEKNSSSTNTLAYLAVVSGMKNIIITWLSDICANNICAK